MIRMHMRFEEVYDESAVRITNRRQLNDPREKAEIAGGHTP